MATNDNQRLLTDEEIGLGAPGAGAPKLLTDSDIGLVPKRTWGEAIKDTGSGVAGGVGGLIKSAGDLYGLATGNMKNGASEFGSGVQEYWDGAKSDALKAKIAQRKANIDAQESTLGKAWTAIKDTVTDPALAMDTVANNAATMVPGAVAGRLAAGAKFAAGMNAARAAGPVGLQAQQAIATNAAKIGTGVAVGTGAVQQGADVSGDIYGDMLKKPDAVWNANPEFVNAVARNGGDRDAAKREIATQVARASFVPAVAVSVAANAIPGGTMLERALVGGAAKETIKDGTRFALPKAIAKGMLGEGTQETFEEGGGRLAANIAAQKIADPTHDTWDQVGENAGMGAAGGLLLGGVGGAFHRTDPSSSATQPDVPPQSNPNNPLADATTSPGAAGPNAPQPPAAPPPQAPDFQTSPGAAGPREGLDFTRDVDTSGLALEDPAEVERQRAATMDFQPADTTPQWDTTRGAAAQDRQPGLDNMPAPEFDTGALGLESQSGAMPEQRIAELKDRLSFIDQQAKANGWDKRLIDARNQTRAELDALRGQGATVPTAIDPVRQLVKQSADAGGAISPAAVVALDLGATSMTQPHAQQQVSPTTTGVPNGHQAAQAQQTAQKPAQAGAAPRAAAERASLEGGPGAAGEVVQSPVGVGRAATSQNIGAQGPEAARAQGPAQAGGRGNSNPALTTEAPNAQTATPQAAPAATTVSAARPAAVEAAGAGGEFSDLFDEQGRSKFSGSASVKEFKKRTGLGQDGVRAIQAAVQDGRPITLDEARQSDIAGQERRSASLEQAKAASEAESRMAKENAAKPAEQRKLLGDYEIPGLEGAISRVRVFQQGTRIEAVGISDKTANHDLSGLIQIGKTVEQALAALYGDHAPNEAPNHSRVKRIGQPNQAKQSSAQPAQTGAVQAGQPAAPNAGGQVATPTNLREGLANIRAQKQREAAQAGTAAGTAAGEAAGPATIPATTGVARESQASQTQQGSTQSTQAGGPQAGAATATASASPAGGNRVQAAGLTNGAPTQNTGAQGTPAPGAQAQTSDAAQSDKAKWIKAVVDKSRLNGSSGVQLTVTPQGNVTFSGDPRSTKDGRALLATYEEALRAGATKQEIADALMAPRGQEAARPDVALTNEGDTTPAAAEDSNRNQPQSQDQQAQVATKSGAQAETSEQRAQRVASAGEAWTRMPTVEREALAARADGLNPIQRKRVPSAAWANLNVSIQRRLADAMGGRAEKTGGNQAAAATADVQEPSSRTPDPASTAGLDERRGILAKLRDTVAALGEKARKAAAERENRQAGREIERELFRELTAANAGMAGKTQEEVHAAVKARLVARDATTALNVLAAGRLARAIHKHLQVNATNQQPAAGRDPLAKQEAILEGLGAAYGEEGPEPLQQANFLLGMEHALAGKTKSTLSGDGLADMVKGYKHALAWIETPAGAKWFEGKGRKKLENTGTDLRRHWEAMKEQMKAGESDMKKAWAQIEAATNRADLFAPYLPEGAKPGWVKYVTDLRGEVQPFKKWLQGTYANWYGSTRWGRKTGNGDNLQFILEGSRYPGDLNPGDRQKWQTDQAYRLAWLQEAAGAYIEKVKSLTAFLDGSASVAQASTRMVDIFIKDEYRAKAMKPGEYMGSGYVFNDLGNDLMGRYSKISDVPGVLNGGQADMLKYRFGSDWAQIIIEKEDTLALPTKATPLTPPKLDRVTRDGGKDWRKGKDVTPQQFKDAFGFADVGFGNWVGARNDQDHLNYAYDAFMDMAEHMGIEPKYVGLSGTLHFTIGALGHGKHAAHFHPAHPGPTGMVQVINLTNTKGDGTVYHEWGHALDHNLGGDWSQVRAKIINALTNKVFSRADWEHKAANFLTGGAYWRGNKRMDKVDAAVHAIDYYKVSGRRPTTAYKTNADQLGKDYWGNEKELFARAIEAWAVDTMGHTNTYLAQPAWAGDGAVTQAKGYRGTPYPTGTERTLFNELLTALAKSITVVDGKLTVSNAAFEKNLPALMLESRAAAAELGTKEGMRAFQRQLMERRENENAEAQAKRDEAARVEREEQDRLAAEAMATLQAPTVDEAPASQTAGPLTDDDLAAIFDEAAAELREGTQEEPDTPAPGEAMAATEPESVPVVSPKEPRAAPASAESAADKSAAALVAEAAKLGVKGVGEAMAGLAKLFGGGPGRLNSFPSGFDEETYAKAKPHFKAALTAFQDAGKTLKDLFKLLIQQFGDGVKPYAVQFAKDEGLGAQLSKAPQQGESMSPSAKVAGFVHDQLAKNEAFTWQALFAQADAAFAGTQAEGKYTPKDAYDAMEAGMNSYILANPGAFNPNASNEAAALIVTRLHNLTQLLPTQSKRTAEQDEFQQFSTVPALAFAANWAAAVSSGDTMLEPSAGIGGLAVFAKNAGARLVLNELSARRAGVLREVFPGAKVYQENAEQINNILSDSDAPSVVVMNPPFSATAGRIQGKRDTKVGALHVEQALKRLTDGGRLVAIVGEGMNLDRPAFKDWWDKIRQEYDVRAVIPMDGSGYAKYGTTFDNAILVIDKAKPSGRAIVTTPAKSYTELINLLAEIRNDRPQSSIPSSTADEIELHAAEQALGEPDAAGEGVTANGQPDGIPGAGVGDGDAGGRSGLGPRRRGGGGGGGSRRPRRDGGKSGGRSGRAGDNAAGGGVDDASLDGGPDTTKPSGLTITAADESAPQELTESVFESYRPQRLQVSGAKNHPGPLVQSAAMAAVLPPAPTYTPNLPANTVSDGLLSIAQIEAVVYAGQAHAETLPPQVRKAGEQPVTFRRGFFIGDGTGVGKGREISGILLDNIRQGRKRHVWVSEKQGLMNDAKRDYKGVLGDDTILFNQNQTKAEDAIPDGDGILFTTYSTLRSGAQSQATAGTEKPATKAQLEKAFPVGSPIVNNRNDKVYYVHSFDVKTSKIFASADPDAQNYTGALRFSDVVSIAGYTDFADGDAVRAIAAGKHAKQLAASGKTPKAAGQSRLDQLVNWLGEDFDGVIAFDEAHNAGNAVSIKGERGSSDPSDQALAVVELQERLPNARVVYVSATGATQVSNLSFATRLGLWGQGTPFPSVQNFIAEMNAGGLASMELVARDLKQMGSYMARSLSFEGVTYSRLEHELTPIQRDIYNRLAEAWQVTLQNMDKALEMTGAVGKNGKGNSKAKAAVKAAYWSAQQRFFNQIITSMQMPTVLSQIEADVAAGHAVVLQLVNTNEAQQTRAIAERKVEGATDLEDLDLTPRDMLIQMVQNAFPVVQHQEVMDDNGKTKREPVKNADGSPVLNRDAVAMRDKLLEDLRDIRVPDGPLEMVLNQFGPERVAEVTGRTQRVVRKDDGQGNLKAQLENRGSSAARADADSFMADKKPILVFSDAGGTGFSFHADLTKTNQRKRKHYLIQPGWRADKAVQGFGRTHRTNQASAPHYFLASTDIPAQKRFLSAIARRLDQLGALTKGQRDTANQGMFSERDNLESKYATQAVRQFFEDGVRGRLAGISFQDFLRQTGLEDIMDTDTNSLVESKMPSTRLFLNRMLSLTLDMQNKVFDAFLERMDEKVMVAQERGEFDAGLQTIRALESKVVSDDVAYVDEKTGAETRLVELELKHATTIYQFPEKLAGAGYVVNAKSGKVYVRTKRTARVTTKSGAVVDGYRLQGTTGVQLKDETDFASRDGVDPYRTITEQEARELWAAENAKRPEFFTERIHMVVGAMLPIWDRLKVGGAIKVARTQTVDGRRLLGMLVDKKSLPELRKRLNLSSSASKLTPEQVMVRLLQGDTGELSNGWKLERVRVSNDLRIEITNGYINAPTGRELTGIGVLMERINWKERYFVPTGAAGVPVLARLTANRPVVELSQADAGGADASFSRTPASSKGPTITGLYSALSREIEALPTKNAPVMGWQMAITGLVKNGKIKADEVEWSGLNDWLDTRQGRVTKDEVLEYLRGNGVQVQEVTLGNETQEAAVRRWMDERAQLEFAMPFDSLDESDQDYLRGKADNANISVARDSKYGQYTLPGGENYREVLLTLPERSDRVMVYQVVGAYPKDGFGSRDEAQAYIDGLTERAKIATKDPATKEVGELLLAQFERNPFSIYKYESKESRAKGYRSNHWDQPDVLAHVRVNDRVDADGKRVLFVEEIQSDWGQDGKKRGIKGAFPSEVLRAAVKGGMTEEQATSDIKRLMADPLGEDGNDTHDNWRRLIDATQDSGIDLNEVFHDRPQSGVPNAPFIGKTDAWLNLALKRVITMAVDGGYDKVAFVTGEQSAERYDLSKQVEHIDYVKSAPDRWNIAVVTKSGDDINRDAQTADQLEELVGKEVAQKIVGGEGQKGGGRTTLRGLDLKVGGEGMKAFYDKIVPNAAKALVKKLGGGQLEDVYLGEANSEPEMIGLDDDGDAIYDEGQEVGSKPQPGFTITPTMREKVAGGLPLFTQASQQPPSRADSNARNVATQMLVDGLKAKWSRAPEIIVARNMQDAQIPQAVRDYDAELKSQGATGEARGFIYQGKVYLLSDQLKGPQQIAEVLFHEVLGHYGLRSVFGNTLDSILQQMGTMRRKEVVAKARSYGLFDSDALGGLDKDAASDAQIWAAMSAKNRLSAAEEVLAEMAQTQPSIGFVQRAISAIRNWLRAHVPGFNNLTLTDADIVQAYILPARGYVTRSNESVQQAIDRAMRDAGFSRAPGKADQTQTENFKRWFGNSEVVDADGKPLRVFHGTTSDIRVFAGKVGADGNGAFFFTESPEAASAYAKKDRARLDEVYRLEEQASEVRRQIDVLEDAGRSYPDPEIVALEREWDSLSRKARELEVAPEGAGSNVIPAYLSIQNPLVIDMGRSGKGQFDMASIEKIGNFIEQAKADGRDGVIVRNTHDSPEAGEAHDIFIAFRPEQIKSAIGNNGNFDPNNPDIRFSRSVADRVGNAISSATVTDVKKLADYKKADWLGMGLQLLGRRQLVDIYGNDLPQLKAYNRLAAQMDAEKNEVGAEADQLADRWGKLKDERQLAELMHDATLAQIDPAKPYVDGDDKMRYQMLAGRFNGLSDDAKAVYRDARNAYQKHHEQVRAAIRARIERSELSNERKADLLKRMDAEFFESIKGVYFPLARFGDYVVAVRGPDGSIASVNRAETMREAQALRESLLKAFPATGGHSVLPVTLSKKFIANQDMVGRGFMSELYGAIENMELDASARTELEDTLGQLYLASLPDLSWAKHGIHRKGMPGFSQDARRAFAKNMFHGARYLAKLNYADQMQEQLADAQKHVDMWKEVGDFDQTTMQRVVDEMNARHDAAMNPKGNPVSTALTSLGFVFHLGLSPASAMVNITQTALVAYPVLGAKWGFDRAGAALLKASKESAKGKNDITKFLSKEERDAYDEAVRSGVIDVTMAHDLAGIATGEDAGVMWKLRPVMKWASFLFHHAEKFNRQATFVAAYRLARESGADTKAAYEQAADATYKGHFDYSSGNRPSIMQGNVARVVLLFKQYGQNMVYSFARAAHQSIKGEKPEVRREARRVLSGLLVSHAMAAGVLGLPMVTTLLAAASMIGGDDDEPWDAKVALQNLLADTFGQKPAEVLTHGLSRLTPWDISSRVGLDKLILPDIQEGLEGQRLGESAMAAALGPVAGIGISVLKGLQQMSDGQYQRGLESMLPAALRGPMKALRFEQEGAKDKTGIVIKDELTPAEVFGQALGFAPSDVRNATEGKSAIMQLDRQLNQRRRALVEHYAMAQMAGDQDGMEDAKKSIAKFNEKNPTRKINPINLAQSVRNRQKRIDQAQDGVYLPKNHLDAMEAGRFAFAE